MGEDLNNKTTTKINLSQKIGGQAISNLSEMDIIHTLHFQSTALFIQ